MKPFNVLSQLVKFTFVTSIKSEPGRCVKDGKHGLSSEEGDTLLDLLRDVAQSPSPTDDNQPLNHHYHQHVQNLMVSEIWKQHTSVQEFMNGKWLGSP